MLESDLKLFALFAVVVGCLILRISVESTGYISPDSVYYLEVAENLKNGDGLVHSAFGANLSQSNNTHSKTYLAVWPLGYPFLIFVVASLLQLPVFWASKLVNFIFLGLCFFFFRKINQERAYLMGLTMCSFTFLEVFSFTWSEGPFVLGVLWLGYILKQFYEEKENKYLFLQLFLCCTLLFLTRYIGGFYFLLIAGLSIWFLIFKRFKKAILTISVLVALSLLAGLYLYQNYLKSGFITGMARIIPFPESIDDFLKYLFIGLFNEFFILKNYYFRGEPVLIFLLTSLYQIIILFLIWHQNIKSKFNKSLPSSVTIYTYTLLGLFYLLILIIARRLSPFDEFDYRLLSPFMICMNVVLVLLLDKLNQQVIISKISQYLILLFGTSLLFNLPKVYLFNYFKSIMQMFY